ncbi:hypothetical protein AAG747_16390 [Rapidithrix thailandica]|uniref:Uncharacterized protein n=1 Tax=Rapidithrix thailandica TaxID=413964 RepID=A0AAW9S952_9BACT
MKNTEFVDIQAVTTVFWNLDDYYKKLITKSEIMFVLMKLKEYYNKAFENEINETAFLDEVQYILREAGISKLSLSKLAIEEILRADALSRPYWDIDSIEYYH